jgi:hypothetical protein
MGGKLGFVRQVVEKLCVVITIILVYENALVFYQHLFPYWWTHGHYGWFFFHLVVGHWLLLNTVGHYYLATTTLPGFVADLNSESPQGKELTYTNCSKCGVMRPPRAHHCKICQKCVVRYDHHCECLTQFHVFVAEKSRAMSCVLACFFLVLANRVRHVSSRTIDHFLACARIRRHSHGSA